MLGFIGFLSTVFNKLFQFIMTMEIDPGVSIIEVVLVVIPIALILGFILGPVGGSDTYQPKHTYFSRGRYNYAPKHGRE